MRRFNFWKLDAFTAGASAGNPAALVLLEAGETVSEAEMQRLATEVAGEGFVTEVAFARPSGAAELELRYFSCEREVPFCGHATVAALYHLFATMPEYRELRRLGLHTRKGRLEAENRITTEDGVFIAAPEPAFPEIRVTVAEAARALGVPEAAIERSRLGADGLLPVSESGQKCLLVPFVGLDAALACAPDYGVLRAFVEAKGLAAVVIHTAETQLPGRALRTRVFPPVFGYLEDPATGSGNAPWPTGSGVLVLGTRRLSRSNRAPNERGRT